MIIVKSPAFTEGHAIPAKNTADGDDVSPELTWSHAPKGTVEVAVLMDDPDAPGDDPWVHWLIRGIPANALGLAAGHHETTVPAGSPASVIFGKNSWGTLGYRGPAPPKGHGTHHYHFKVFALDSPLELPAGFDKHSLLEAISGHVLARGELVGTYHR
jgi:Raf kinase inhibitor-like YbhB/YbcL family protein